MCIQVSTILLNILFSPTIEKYSNKCLTFYLYWKVRLEEELEHKQKDNYKLENKVKAMSDELMKGNEIIKKLQGEIKNYHTKVCFGI